MTNPDRVAFTIFGRDIYWYGVLMAVGIIIAVLLAIREGKRKKLPEDTIVDLCLVIIPCGIVGARLYYVLFELKSYLADPIRMLYIWEGGLAIYGAVIGGLLGALIYAKKKKIRFLRLTDCIAPGLVLAQAIGRWGNFFNQEAFGNPVTNPNMLWFPLSVKIEIPHSFNGFVDGVLHQGVCTNPYHLATFFYESMWCLLIFLFLWFVFRKRAKHDGDVFLTYAMLYSFERMLVEGLRGDSLWLIHPQTIAWLSGGIRVSQLLSFIMFAGVTAFFIVRAVREKKTGALMWPAPLCVSADTAQTDLEAENSTDANAPQSEQDECEKHDAEDEKEDDNE
ncbi:MAG: prolipoprotein diacylglyceryl transferase [Clostridia bacterium]